MALENSIDDRNKDLYQKLKEAGVEIELKIDTNQPTWSVREVRRFQISSPNDEPNAPAFAHELLHIKLNLTGFSDVLTVYKHFNENNSIFTPDFIGTLNNNLAHFQMLDEFLAVGFKVDEFLQDTPKTYFLRDMVYATTGMVLAHKTNTADPCSLVRDIVLMCASAKLFELYKLKDPATENGLHPDLVLNPLREINSKLVEKLEILFSEWASTKTVDNLQFYYRLNEALKEFGYKTLNDCSKSHLT